MPTLSDAEAFGIAKPLSDAEVFGGRDDAVPDTPWERALSVLKDQGLRLTKAAAATADLFAGVPGQAISLGANIAGRVGAVVEGKNRREVEAEGARLQEHVPAQVERFLRMAPGGLREPVQTIVNTLAGGESYDQKVVGEAIDKVAGGIDRVTRGFVSKEDAKLLIDSAMLAGGAKGTDVIVKDAITAKPRSGAAERASYEAQPLSDAEVFGPPESLASGEKLQRQFTKQIDTGIKELTPPDIKTLIKQAKSPEAAVENLFARAAREGKVEFDARQELTAIREANQAPFREAESVPPSDRTPEQVRLDEALAKEPAFRTPEDREVLESWWRAGLGAQEGKVDPRLLGILGGLGVGTATAFYLKEEHPEVFKALGKWMVDKLRPPEEDMIKKYQERGKKPLMVEGAPSLASVTDKATEEGFGAGDLVAPLLVGMAVKGKGGMWHPEAVERLVKPLSKQLHGGFENTGEPLAADIQADRMIRGYLNKHAGTATDPLKDVEVPFGEGTKRWEELTDAAIKITQHEGAGRIGGVDIRPGETTYSLWQQEGGINRSGEATAARRTIESYLSHVGDFLRQSVKPDKLPFYDLVRAVKETAANDERVAKEMEKASSESTKDLPLYKEYPDGTSWRQIALPEKLTPSQAKMVKPLEETGGGDQIVDANSHRYVAVDSKGEPIRNSYTEEEARGRTPEEAWLAGELAKEGNALGHCVGGYCESVASGESRIYSLRDAKGKSHVTVEVGGRYNHLQDFINYQNRDGGDFAAQFSGMRNGPEWNRAVRNSPEYKAFERALADGTLPQDIIQIKGAQNRAPVAKYLPYVQDFVRQGKWGEVGDLENTGLVRIPGETRGSRIFVEPDAARAAIKEGAPRRFKRDRVSPEEAENIIGQIETADPHRLQQIADAYTDDIYMARQEAKWAKDEQGSVDPKLLVTLGAMALGGTAGAMLSDNKLLGGVIGALGAGGLTRVHPKQAAAEIGRIFAADPRIRINKLADTHEAEIARAARSIWQQATKVAEAAPKAEDRAAITHAIQQGRIGSLPAALRSAANQAREFFTAMGAEGERTGVLKGLIDNYVTNLWDLNGKNKGVWEEILAKAGGPSMSPESRFALKRKITNLEEGKKLGLTPMTEDVAQIMSIYGNSLARSMANKKMLLALRSQIDPASGTKLVLPSTKAPHAYETIDHPQMNGLRVHPDIVPSMKFIFDNSDPGVVARGLEGVNTALKRSAVSFSLFHAKALVDAQIGAHGMLKGVPMAIKGVAQAAAPQLFGESKFLKQLREGGAGDLVDKAQSAGLKISMEKGKLADEDVNGSFYSALTMARKGLDSLVPGLGLPIKGIEAINYAVDVFMWERLHAAMKLGTFSSKLEVLRNSDAKAAAREGRAPRTEAQLAEQAASFTNDIYGGLNWRRLAEEAHTKWGRDIASAIYSPKGRRVSQLLLFAPDWTISTTRAATRAAGQLLGYEKGSGLRGLLEPQNATDLHRQYMIRSAFYYALVGDAMNYALSGHHLWDNKDWTMIDMGDGRRMQWSKHSMEPIHWMQKPGQQALNKLGFFPKEAANQMLGTEYLSASGHAPRMDTSPLGRLEHVGKSMTPIAAQQAFGSTAAEGGALSGFLGAPIYGKTFEQRQLEKAERKRKAILQRIERRNAKREGRAP